MNVNWRIYLKEDNIKVFGKGPKMLLLKIDELGSIRKAAISMKLSYTKAWNMILNLEKGTNIKVLEKQIGGKNGGGSILTEEVRILIRKFDELEIEVGECIIELFNKKFKE
ncbi:LysR family transcriptional regulator [Clostridium sp. FP2]|uniref:winged helix-turn-helix domain-containing protein n=1 Tax=Clostridium TaxID=1485 RepID=UPI0013E90AEC|nr:MULTISPECIES: LysR family transcriptional regulator [Clostridium]MBW9156810.1 LysR family transcriptional regulator [Clostridium tagluense]MBZ9621981.1 LysR family transcriptional regulator [Clostridium sp. FP2]WLC66292.1 LysR family transcriptional regulator [Clostridium tagluense]